MKIQASLKYSRFRLYSLFILNLFAAALLLLAKPTTATVLQGEHQWIHDPSQITKCNGKYFVFYTGDNIPMRYSTDLVTWKTGKPVFEKVPDWVRKAVPAAKSEFVWAPDVIYVNNKYYLYYSFSTFGSKVSLIGLVTNATLDPESPNYKWEDKGLVIQSSNATPYNAIDAALTLDERGDLWMSFGSWSRDGLHLVKLDKTSGKTAGAVQTIAAPNREGPEAPFIYLRNGYYYLFFNDGYCCRGSNSTYRIIMARSKSITGPYLDKEGKSLAQGGGTLFLGSDGVEIGPGHMGVLSEHGIDRFSFHYYDSRTNGIPTLGLQVLNWDKDGWPTPTKEVDPGRYTIVSKASGLALGVRDLSSKDGTPVDQFALNLSPFQSWNISPVGNGYFSIGSLATGHYFDVFECSSKDGTTINLYPWFGNDCQRWQIEPTGDGYYRIVSKSTGNVVTLPNGDKTPRAVMQAFAWKNDDSQKWQLRKLP